MSFTGACHDDPRSSAPNRGHPQINLNPQLSTSELPLGLPLIQRQRGGTEGTVVFAKSGEGDGRGFGVMLGTEAADGTFERFEQMFAKADEWAGNDYFLRVEEGIDLAEDPAKGLGHPTEGFFDPGVASIGGVRDFLDRE